MLSGGQRTTLGVGPQASFTYLCETDLSLTWSFVRLAGWPQSSRDLPVSTFPVLGL